MDYSMPREHAIMGSNVDVNSAEEVDSNFVMTWWKGSRLYREECDTRSYKNRADGAD